LFVHSFSLRQATIYRPTERCLNKAADYIFKKKQQGYNFCRRAKIYSAMFARRKLTHKLGSVVDEQSIKTQVNLLT
jgi:hypothetical protein